MKVVLFCGGLGTRLREFSETLPKPLVNIGSRPIVWHLMKYYAHFGHREFILCLGYGGQSIREYFLNYSECLSNDFVLGKGGQEIRLYESDMDEWEITFVDTGVRSTIGERLRAVKRYVDDEDVFLANYSDGVSDLDLTSYLEYFTRQEAVACFASVRPYQSFHVVSMGDGGLVESLQDIRQSPIWINGGFFALRREIFEYLKPGEELVGEPFQRLIERRKLVSYRHNGFWACMDTLKDKMWFDEMDASGKTPWVVWKRDQDAHRVDQVQRSTQANRPPRRWSPAKQ